MTDLVGRAGAASFGRFEVLGRIGEGTSSPLLVAFDPLLGRQVALREIGGGSTYEGVVTDQLRRSITTMASISHPNCVRVFDLLDDTRPPVVVMEHVPGATLEEILGQSHPLTAPEASSVLAGALEGLDHIHSQGLSHGCLTPARVLVDPSGTSKLRDVGMDPSSDPLAGSYLAPEELAGGAPSPAADVYAAGAVLYACLEGDAPSNTPARRGPPVLRHAGSPALASLVVEAMSPEPGRRPASARTFLDRLLAASEEAFGPGWRPAAGVALAGLGVGGAAAIAGALAAAGGAAAVGAAAAGAGVAAGAVTGAQVSGGAVTGAQISGGAATGRNAFQQAARPARRRSMRHLGKTARRLRTAAAHHPVTSAAALVVVTTVTVTTIVLSGGGAPLASTWRLASASVAPQALSCSDPAHCVGLAGQDAVIVSPGDSVRFVPLPASVGTLAALACTSDVRCWAVGSSASGTGSIADSVDGGLSWRIETVPAGVTALTAISCAPRTTDCWAVGGTSVVETTGGATWHLAPAPATAGKYGLISCGTSSTCLLAAGGTLLTTSDAGAQWQPGKQSFPLLYGASSIDCVSATVCWMAGNYQSSLQSVSPIVYRSTDGGTTWTVTPLPAKIPIYGANDISCTSATSCVVSGTTNDGGIEGSSGAPLFASTTTAGASWHVVLASPTIVYVPGLDCVTPGPCWIWGKNGIGTIADGGASWSPALLPATMTPAGLSCSSDTSCLMSGAAPFATLTHTGIGGNNPNGPFVLTGTKAGGALSATGDGGGSWTFTYTDLKLSGLGVISCPQTDTCEVAGTLSSGATALFRLSGNALSPASTPTGLSSAAGLSCDPSTCWLSGIVAGKPAVEHSNGSARWTTVPVPAGTSSVGAISCPSSTTCLLAAVVDSKPSLLETSPPSGGFKAVALPTTVSSLGGLDCATTTTCWVGATLSTQVANKPPVMTQVFLRTTSLGQPLAAHEQRWAAESLAPGLGLPATVSCPSTSACLAVVPEQSIGFVVVDAGQFKASLAGSLENPTTTP